MSQKFNTIGLMGRYHDSSSGSLASLRVLLNYLTSHGYSVVLEKNTGEELKDSSYPTYPSEALGQHCDLMVVVGGDGSLLNAARAAAPHGTPVLGIHRGRLGFLTDIHPNDIEKKIGDILKGQYFEETRFLLNTQLKIENKIIPVDNALNDVVLSPGDNPQMIEFEININDQFVCKQRADGLILATPTGSTAYALSGGGPILHPQLDAIVLVPMFPHTLSSRPIVIEGNSRIDIFITSHNRFSPKISCDGHAHVKVPPHSHIYIEKSPHLLRLIHPLDYHYFETLRSKLDWEKHY